MFKLVGCSRSDSGEALFEICDETLGIRRYTNEMGFIFQMLEGTLSVDNLGKPCELLVVNNKGVRTYMLPKSIKCEGLSKLSNPVYFLTIVDNCGVIVSAIQEGITDAIDEVMRSIAIQWLRNSCARFYELFGVSLAVFWFLDCDVNGKFVTDDSVRVCEVEGLLIPASITLIDASDYRGTWYATEQGILTEELMSEVISPYPKDALNILIPPDEDALLSSLGIEK